MMKFLSILTFLTFLAALTVRFFSHATVKELESYLPEENKKEEIFDVKNKKKSVQMLDALNDIIDEDQKIEKKEKVSKENTINKTKISYSYDHPQLRGHLRELNDAFYAQEDNFQKILSTQKKIREVKKKENLKILNIEDWSPQLILYFIIQEGDDIQDVNNYTLDAPIRDNDIPIDREEFEEYKKQSNSKEFLKRILEFKNIKKLQTENEREPDEEMKREIASEEENSSIDSDDEISSIDSENENQIDEDEDY